MNQLPSTRFISISIFVVAALAVLGPLSSPAAETGDTPPALVRQIKILPDKSPDCGSLKSIAESVTRGCANNDQKAIAIYNFMQLTHYHRQYPSEPGGVPVLKEINCYGWSLCGGLHAEQSAIWRELGWDWRFVGWDGHTTVEARYDDRWHYLDVFLKFYAWMPDGKGGRTIAGEDDLNSNPQQLIRDAFVLDPERGCVYMKDNQFVSEGGKVNWRAPAFLVCGDELSGVVSGLKTHRGRDRSEGWGGINHACGSYRGDVDLAPGFSLLNTWDPMPEAWYWAGQKTPPAHTCSGHKDTRNDPGFGLVLEPYLSTKPARSYANGVLSFEADFSNPAFLKALSQTENVRQAGHALAPADDSKPARVVLNLASPYIITRASGEAPGAEAIEISIDGGKIYKAVDLRDFSAAVKGQTAALVRITFKEALKALKLRAIVQNNPGALPYLSPGRNTIAVSTADSAALGENQLVVTCAYRLGSRARSFAELCEQGKEVARQHQANWSDQVTCVRKVFRAADLPATFVVDCPTPAGQYPVYPRMMFIQREIVPPGAAPSPLPAGAIQPRLGPGEELATLPNPFLVGTETPPPARTRAVKTTRIPLNYAHYVNEKGEAGKDGTLRWPKNAGEKGKVLAGAVILSGEISGLPAAGLAAARLCLPVLQAHEKAPGKLGAVLLEHLTAADRLWDRGELAQPDGTVVLPVQPSTQPTYSPPRVVSIDLTKPIKAVARGERKCRGFALRMVPDRGVDDGWTVRCSIAPAGPFFLEVDVYTE